MVRIPMKSTLDNLKVIVVLRLKFNCIKVGVPTYRYMLLKSVNKHVKGDKYVQGRLMIRDLLSCKSFHNFH